MILKGIIMFLMVLNRDRSSANPNPFKLEVSVRTAPGIHTEVSKFTFCVK